MSPCHSFGGILTCHPISVNFPLGLRVGFLTLDFYSAPMLYALQVLLLLSAQFVGNAVRNHRHRWEGRDLGVEPGDDAVCAVHLVSFHLFSLCRWVRRLTVSGHLSPV